MLKRTLCAQMTSLMTTILMTSLDNDHVTGSTPSSAWGKSTGVMLWFYVGPLIFTVGIAGNALILVTMAQRRMQGSSTCVYLRCMAVADLLVLLTGMIPEWLEESHIFIVKVMGC